MSNLRNLVRRRIHRERAQPRARARLGLLEKHKDYKLRAIDYHRKQDHIKKLQQKAAFRNPDEFYFAMHSESTEGGVHVKRARIKRSAKEIREANTTDIGYLTMKSQQEAGKIERLKTSMHMLSKRRVNQHTIFLESKEQAENFDAAEHFETAPELVASAYNRPKLQALREAPIQRAVDARTARKAGRGRARVYKEIQEREGRKRKLNAMVEKLQTQRNLMGKGKRKKIIKRDQFGDEDRSQTVYKWKRERKK